MNGASDGDGVQLTTAAASSSATIVLGVAEEATLRSKRFWRIVVWNFAVMFIALIDRANMSYAALTMKADLGLSDVEYGLGSSAFYGPYVCMQLPAALVVRRLGSRMTLAIIMAVWGTCSMSFALLGLTRGSGPAPFYMLRMGLGAAEGGLIPTLYHCLAQWHSPSDLAVAFGQILSASCISNVVGGLLAAPILQLDGSLGLRGWQWLFVIEAAPALAAALVTLVTLADSPAHASWLSEAERAHLAWHIRGADTTCSSSSSGGGSGSGSSSSSSSGDTGGRERGDSSHVDPSAGGGGSEVSVGRQLRQTVKTLSSCRVWWHALMIFLPLNTLWALVYWQPLLLQRMLGPEATTARVAFLSAGPFGFATLSMLVVSSHAAGQLHTWRLCRALPARIRVCSGSGSRRSQRRWYIAVPLAVGGAATVLAPLALRMPGGGGVAVALAYALLCAANSGIWSAISPFYAWPRDWLPPEEASTVVALSNSVGSLGGLTGPALFGGMSAAFGPEEAATHVHALVTLGSASLVAAVMAATFRPR